MFGGNGGKLTPAGEGLLLPLEALEMGAAVVTS